MLDRRAFLLGSVSAVLAGPLAVEAQQAGKVYRVAVLCPNRCEGPSYEAFRRGLRDSGWVEGHNVLLDARGADGRSGRLRMLADELLGAQPDVMVAIAPQPVRAAKDATSTVPIVMIAVADPVSIGLVPSLARPGGNLTGVATLPGRGLIAKQLELLKELLSAASRIAVFWNSKNEIHRANLHEDLAQAADTLGVQLQMIDVREVSEVEAAFAAAVRGRADALLVVGDPITFAPAARVPERALRARLPAIYLARPVAVAGGLMTYGPDFLDIYRRAGGRWLIGEERLTFGGEEPCGTGRPNDSNGSRLTLPSCYLSS